MYTTRACSVTLHTHTHIYIYIDRYLYIYKQRCIYIYTYIYIWNIDTYTYRCRHRYRQFIFYCILFYSILLYSIILCICTQYLSIFNPGCTFLAPVLQPDLILMYFQCTISLAGVFPVLVMYSPASFELEFSSTSLQDPVNVVRCHGQGKGWPGCTGFVTILQGSPHLGV